MTGICGLYRRGADAAKAPASPGLFEGMAAGLPGREPIAEARLERTVAGGRLHTGAAAADRTAGMVAVVDGSPRWSDPTLARLASERGNGHALLGAYRQHGVAFLKHVSGTFALAVVDEKSGEALLAVDRMGIMPLCYATTADGDLVFGSTTTSVVASGEVAATLSKQSIYSYVYFHVIPSPATIYSNIAKLEPGQVVRIAGKSPPRTEYYWEPRFPASSADFGSLRTELMSTMRKAVAKTNPDTATGAFLSGGLDSSTVCGLTNEISATPLRAYSIGFAEDQYDEMSYAKIAAAHFKLDLRAYYVTPDDIADAIGVIASAYDEPFGNSSAVPTYFCARRARQEGVTRLLGGDGGDELFAGNERYATQQLFERYYSVPKWLRAAAIEPALKHLPTNWSTLTRKARRYVEQARVPMPERLQTYNYLNMNDPAEIFEGSFRADVDTRAPAAEMTRWYARSEGADLVDRMLWFDWKLTLADNDLRKVNRMCTEAGVGVQYPLLDDELVEFSTRVPAALKMSGRELRYFYKRATADFLPNEIISKKKHGFGLPFGVWLAKSRRLQEIVNPAMENLKTRGIFQPSMLDQLMRSHREVHNAFYGNIIWVFATLECWLQAHRTA